MKLLLAALLSIAFIACEQKQEQPATSVTEKNKEMVKLAYSEVVAQQNYSLIDSFFATNILIIAHLKDRNRVLLVLRKRYLNF